MVISTLILASVSIYASKQKQLQKSKSIGISVIINNNDGESLYLFINSLILNRWSPMAMTGEELADEELMQQIGAIPAPPTAGSNTAAYS
jgi:hypothetical protein